MAHVLHGKIEIDFGIKSPAEKYHDVLSCRPHHISNVTPVRVQGCKLHQGKWGTAGSVISWDYVHDGEAKVAKQIIQAIDDEKKCTTFRTIEGDMMKLYKDIVLSVYATPKGEGSVVHWTLEYEKLSEDVPEPYTLLELLVHIAKDIDAHLISTA